MNHVRNGTSVLLISLGLFIILSASWLFVVHYLPEDGTSYTLVPSESISMQSASKILNATTTGWELIKYENTSEGWIFMVIDKNKHVQNFIYKNEGHTWTIMGVLRPTGYR